MNKFSRYNRILLKISGECFASDKLLNSVTRQLVQAHKKKVALAVVVGGGNILRGRDVKGFDRIWADRAGMLATVINGIRITEILKRKATVYHLCTFEIPGFVERYIIEKGHDGLKSSKILILSGGTGSPLFSTDSLAALRAAELEMDAILKATNVAGVYSADPKKHKNARLYRKLSYKKALVENLKVMDPTAFAFCMEKRIPINVFDINLPNAIIDIIQGKQIGSCVC
ncbi:hypothetical protein CH330_06640 [candidate division WOR-3 bacterium JGI_Cruoil_03_51_56]|uniref:Uridylate kinase n=1 Tax=candidate division WOR-3 bacterium JGI_Cruoil_03_51_56 TaxID=1973747 RepID=A0A235BS06_UNCW3|nr:MAG: hypothetical protein CH330_06640 [candidate division WOR-3 bacterium JGI_Cruoil_03_51_56]